MIIDLLIVLGALAFLMLVAYRGYSVILFAPVAALGAVLLTDPILVPPMFSSVFMEKMVGFVKNYFQVFMLGAVFGKMIELSGFSKSIVSAVIGVLGKSARSFPSSSSHRGLGLYREPSPRRAGARRGLRRQPTERA
jgi:H+/gluconate symporter-like permease